MTDNQKITTTPQTQNERISRAQGCLIGQLAGAALGSLVEFQSSEQIRQQHPNSIRDMTDGCLRTRRVTRRSLNNPAV